MAPGGPKRQEQRAASSDERVVQQLATEQGRTCWPQQEVSCARDLNDRGIVETGVASLGGEPQGCELRLRL